MSKWAVPIAELDKVEVPLDRQVEGEDVRRDRAYLSPEDLDRLRLLSITEAGRLRVR